jgi:serine/threonine-protein kinase
VEGAQGFAKPVVIKTMLATGAGRDDRAQLFAREARIVSQLQHPGIVAVIDFGKVDDSLVMVLEYVHGYNLGQWFRYVTTTRGQLPLAQAVHVVLAVLDALAYAHGLMRPNGTPLGIVHRDISPGNVLIDVQGHVKLADFGIARTADDEFKTQEGLFRGTLPYSPPEALQGTPFDGRGDEYSCAVLLYHLLTGVHPFKGTEPANTMTRILTHVAPPVSSLRRDVPPALEAALAKAMSRAPDARFASVAEFAEALRRAGTQSEHDSARDFAAQIAQDFTGDMPERLGLESLAVRDAAWREEQDSPHSSRVGRTTSPPDLQSSITKREGSGMPGTTAELSQQAVAEQARLGPRAWLWVFLALLVASAALVVALVRSSGGAAPAPIIVEKQSLTEPQAAPPTTPSTRVAEVAPVSARATASAPPALTSPSARPKTESASTRRTLASAFQRRQGAIQGCFNKNPGTLTDAQHISVRFDVDRSGHVVAASVSPASLQSQPLGSCILGVARSTDFGPQPEPVSFSIPISARMVPR